MSNSPNAPPVPRVGETDRSAFRRWHPARSPIAARVLLGTAGLLLLVSFLFPYWQVELATANHPQGLRLVAYLGHFDGAPRGLELARLERSQEVAAAIALTLLVLAAAFADRRKAALLGLPAIGFPLAVAADLAAWLPAALCALGERELGCPGHPMRLWGRLELAGQVLVTRPGDGLALAAAAAALVLAACLCRAIGPSRFPSML